MNMSISTAPGGSVRPFTSHGSTTGSNRRPTADVPRPAGFSKMPFRQSGAGGLLEAVVGLFIAWQDRANQRHCLADLDDRLLRDVGLDRLDVDREVAKPFWKA